MLDAIGRALVRMLVTRRRTARVGHGRPRREGPTHRSGTWRGGCGRRRSSRSRIAAIVAIVAPERRAAGASPILILWFISPALVFASGPAARRIARHADATRPSARAFAPVARRTWRFFEELVGPADHWLVPDNYQEDRQDVIAHRTSPTNIGLQLLATMAAYDLGYLSYAGMLDRLEPTFDTLLRMQRYRGHFYNWYDTRTLAPLTPAYISTVDSGNLAGYLLTLRSGLTVAADSAPIIDGMRARRPGRRRQPVRSRNRHARSRTGADRPAQARARQPPHAPRAPSGDPARVAPAPDAARRAPAGRQHPLPRSRGASPRSGGAEALPRGADRSGDVARARRGSVVARQLELDRLTGWMARLQSAGIQDVPAGVPSLAGLIALCDRRRSTEPASSEARQAIERARRLAEELIERGERLSALADDLIEETEFGFLFNAERQLFSIGYSVTDGRLDSSYYDTLASEARLASFMAIATGTVSHEHWFKLGRSLTPTGASRALLSWSASMFEYLMPLLVMRAYRGTLLDETYNAVVRRQIEYGTQRGVPWGISESALLRPGSRQELSVPGVRRARPRPEARPCGRSRRRALCLGPGGTHRTARRARKPRAAARARASTDGSASARRSTTRPSGCPPKHEGGMVLPTWMAHHQGMTLLALDNVLNGSPMQQRFHADPRVQAADLLLQERLPQLVPLKNPPAETATHVPFVRRAVAPPVRLYTTPHTLSPARTCCRTARTRSC